MLPNLTLFDLKQNAAYILNELCLKSVIIYQRPMVDHTDNSADFTIKLNENSYMVLNEQVDRAINVYYNNRKDIILIKTYSENLDKVSVRFMDPLEVFGCNPFEMTPSYFIQRKYEEFVEELEKNNL